MKTIGDIIDDMFANRELRKALESQVKDLKDEYENLEAQLMESMQTIGVSAVKGEKATARISELTVPNIEDWDQVVDYILSTNSTHLLQRKINSVGYRELLAAGENVPGTAPYIKRSISLVRS